MICGICVLFGSSTQGLYLGQPRRWGFPVWGYHFIPGGSGCLLFSLLQPHITEAVMLVERTSYFFSLPATTCRSEALLQVWHLEYNWVLVTLTLSYSKDTDSTSGRASREDQGTPPSTTLPPTHLNTAH